MRTSLQGRERQKHVVSANAAIPDSHRRKPVDYSSEKNLISNVANVPKGHIICSPQCSVEDTNCGNCQTEYIAPDGAKYFFPQVCAMTQIATF
jgi:hypothetical protein